MPSCTVESATSVSHLRFANPSDGYLFGSGLFTTTDGGHTWHAEAAPPVEDLEPAGGLVYRLVFDHLGCPGPCHRSLQVARVGSTNWRTIATAGGVAAQVVVSRADVYVPMYGHRAGGGMDAHTTVLRSTDGGTTWLTSGDPCGSGVPEIDAIAFAAAPGGYLAALCAPRAAQAPTFVLESFNAGTTWPLRRSLPSGSFALIAAGSAEHLAVATAGSVGSDSVTYELLASVDAGRTWRATSESATSTGDAPGSAFLGYEDANSAHWMADDVTIWTTSTGGANWTRDAFP